MERRAFIQTVGVASALSPVAFHFQESKPKNFFTIDKTGNRYFLKSPEGKRFFSIGINHIDSATLRYTENSSIWHEKYRNSMQKWLKEGVRKNLLDWGFNTMGWNQEVVTRAPDNHRHSRSFTPEEYQWLNMPYCHMLHFADFHQWENEIRYPDFFSKGFEDWCDYVARDEASRLADDPNLIGYFYIDCPAWVHNTKENAWRGPLFDPEKLTTEAGKKELSKMAEKYYKTTHEAVRRYDKNHLIFGDRYEASRTMAEEVVLAAVPYVDVICFQHFADPDKVIQNLEFWHKKTGLPTLVADCSHAIKDSKTGHEMQNPEVYDTMYKQLREANSCIGFHLCGAYSENRCRKKGMMDENEKLHSDVVNSMRRVNNSMKKWVESYPL